MFGCQKIKGREAMSQPGCKLAKYLETKEVKSLFFPLWDLIIEYSLITALLGPEILSG